MLLVTTAANAQAPAPAPTTPSASFGAVPTAEPAPVPAPAPASAPPAPPVAPAPPPPAPVPPPPPGAYYPPPPGYYYAPPPPPPKPRYPEHAAVVSSPFFDAVLGGVAWQDRVSHGFTLGGQAGVYIAQRVRLAGRITFPTDDVSREGSIESKLPSFFWAGSAGVVVIDSPSFVWSPGFMVMRSDVSDYGTMLGFSMPFEWVLGNSMRIGTEIAFGRVSGGKGVQCCINQIADRETGTAFWLQFQLGFGLNHPGPLR